MKPKQPDQDFLNMVRLPFILDAHGVSQVLGLPNHEISTLTSAGLLPVLGKDVAKNAIKYYCTAKILELAGDERWLSRVITCLYRRHQERNGINRLKEISPEQVTLN